MSNKGRTMKRCLFAILGSVLFLAGACNTDTPKTEGNAEQVGRSMDEAADSIESAAKDAGDEIRARIDKVESDIDSEMKDAPVDSTTTTIVTTDEKSVEKSR